MVCSMSPLSRTGARWFPRRSPWLRIVLVHVATGILLAGCYLADEFHLEPAQQVSDEQPREGGTDSLDASIPPNGAAGASGNDVIEPAPSASASDVPAEEPTEVPLDDEPAQPAPTNPWATSPFPSSSANQPDGGWGSGGRGGDWR